MPTKLQVVTTLAAVGVTFGLTSLRYRGRYAELARVAIELGRERDQAVSQLSYLAHLVDDSDIELTEFDLIALNNAISPTEE